MPAKKKLLLVAYYYPPFAEVGAVRIAKFVKYLQAGKWDMSVLTVKDKNYTNCNASYSGDVKGVATVRTSTVPKFIKGINEEGFYWTPILLFALIWQLITNRPGAVYFTGGPFYHWLLAPLVRLFGIKYLLDLRDPWRLSPYVVRKSGKFGRWTTRIESFIESFAVKHATAVVNVTSQATQMYINEYPGQSEKFITITNGFDPEDFIDIKPLEISRFDIVYSGKFGKIRDVRPFFRAFQQLIKESQLTPEDIRFIWAGKEELHIEAIIEELNLSSFVKILGFIPYSLNLQYIKGASIAMLIAGKHPYEPTTKIFDYMALSQNILGITNTDGFVAETLSTYQLGTVSRNTADAIFLELSKCYNSKLKIENMSTDGLNQFSRKTLAKQLEKLLENKLLC